MRLEQVGRHAGAVVARRCRRRRPACRRRRSRPARPRREADPEGVGAAVAAARAVRRPRSSTTCTYSPRGVSTMPSRGPQSSAAVWNPGERSRSGSAPGRRRGPDIAACSTAILVASVSTVPHAAPISSSALVSRPAILSFVLVRSQLPLLRCLSTQPFCALAWPTSNFAVSLCSVLRRALPAASCAPSAAPCGPPKVREASGARGIGAALRLQPRREAGDRHQRSVARALHDRIARALLGDLLGDLGERLADVLVAPSARGTGVPRRHLP